MAYIRQRGPTSWCLTVKHKALPRPFHRFFDTEEEANTFGEQLEAMLKRGVVPQSLLDSYQTKKNQTDESPMVTAVVLDYLRSAPSTFSEADLRTVMLLDWTLCCIDRLNPQPKAVK